LIHHRFSSTIAVIPTQAREVAPTKKLQWQGQFQLRRSPCLSKKKNYLRLLRLLGTAMIEMSKQPLLRQYQLSLHKWSGQSMAGDGH